MFLALVTGVGGSLTGASPAYAASLPLFCANNPAVNADIACFVAIPPDRDISAIVWFVNGEKKEASGSDAGFQFPCTPGQRYVISYEAYLSPPQPPAAEKFEGSMSVACRGALIINVFAGCSSGGNRLQCSVTWTGGTPPVSIRWTINGTVRTFFNDRWWLDISCNGVSDMSISVTVFDAYSAQTASGYCSCHGGPLD
jgi:hypothetical protein